MLPEEPSFNPKGNVGKKKEEASREEKPTKNLIFFVFARSFGQKSDHVSWREGNKEQKNGSISIATTLTSVGQK